MSRNPGSLTDIIMLLALCMMACSPGTTTMTDSTETTENIQGSDGIKIIPIHHSSLALQWEDYSILIDPHGEPARYHQFLPVDLLLITDIHGDHLDTNTLRGLDLAKARIIAPPAVADMLPADLKPLTEPLRNGESREIIGIMVEAIPMYNFGEGEVRHPKGRGNGYVLKMGGKRIYVSGDTEDIPEMRALRNIDIAFVCMNLPYTMSVAQAAAGVLAFKPKVVYPYHYRGLDGLSDVKEFERLVAQGDPGIEVRLADWY